MTITIILIVNLPCLQLLQILLKASIRYKYNWSHTFRSDPLAHSAALVQSPSAWSRSQGHWCWKHIKTQVSSQHPQYFSVSYRHCLEPFFQLQIFLKTRICGNPVWERHTQQRSTTKILFNQKYGGSISGSQAFLKPQKPSLLCGTFQKLNKFPQLPRVPIKMLILKTENKPLVKW